MSLSSLSKSIICMALALNLGACSYFLPSTSPNLGGLLAEKGDTRPFETPLPINTEPKRMALGAMFTVGVKADGTVWSWGSGSSGELGRNDYNEHTDIPLIIPDMTNFVEVAVGSNHVLALRKDGTVWSWGNNEKGQLGYKEDGHIEPNYYRAFQKLPKQIPDLTDIVSIAAGANFSLALDKQGKVWGWGSEAYILKNVFDNTIQKAPKVVYEDKNIAKIVTERGRDTAIIFTNGGAIIFPTLTEEMFDDVTRQSVPKEYRIYHVPFNDVVDISIVSGALYTILRKDGTVWALGMNKFGSLGQCDYKPYKGFVRVKNLSHIKKINADIAWDDTGHLWHWGVNVYEKWLLKQLYGNYYNGHEPCPIHESKQTDLSFFVSGYVNQINKVIGLDNGVVFFLEERRSKRKLHPVGWSWK
ncbi:MAG: hypothetical protein I8H92_00040 [Moraxellaceae bacterium]|nr:hypothetical protein [Moraxellaceae bacterium]